MSVAWLTQQLSTHGIELSNKQQQQFQTYYQMLVVSYSPFGFYLVQDIQVKLKYRLD
jgi:16S rRNA G527 N7-methylase RsmG